MLKHEEICQQAVELLRPAIENLFKLAGRDPNLHIVFMDPRKKPWDVQTFNEAVLHEYSFNKENWTKPYLEIARDKAAQAWTEQRSNAVAVHFGPAVLRPGDTRHCGSFEYYGAIVACSGIQSYFDLLVSGWLAVAVQQITQHEIQKYFAEHPDEHFLPL